MAPRARRPTTGSESQPSQAEVEALSRRQGKQPEYDWSWKDGAAEEWLIKAYGEWRRGAGLSGPRCHACAPKQVLHLLGPQEGICIVQGRP
jgi:hypothetical protein